MQWLRSGSLALPNETRTFETKTEAKRNGREEKKISRRDGRRPTADGRTGNNDRRVHGFFFYFFIH